MPTRPQKRLAESLRSRLRSQLQQAIVAGVAVGATATLGSISYADGAVEFSADNGQTYTSRETLMIGTGDYARLAVSEEITHIKWAISDPIAPADTGAISFEAVLK